MIPKNTHIHLESKNVHNYLSRSIIGIFICDWNTGKFFYSFVVYNFIGRVLVSQRIHLSYPTFGTICPVPSDRSVGVTIYRTGLYSDSNDGYRFVISHPVNVHSLLYLLYLVSRNYVRETYSN